MRVSGRTPVPREVRRYAKPPECTHPAPQPSPTLLPGLAGRPGGGESRSITYCGCVATVGNAGALVYTPYARVLLLSFQSMTLEMSVDDGDGHVDGGVHSPLMHEALNTAPTSMLVLTSASASRRPASAAWNAMFMSLV